jgi:hypothetical protein
MLIANLGWRQTTRVCREHDHRPVTGPAIRSAGFYGSPISAGGAGIIVLEQNPGYGHQQITSRVRRVDRGLDNRERLLEPMRAADYR